MPVLKEQLKTNYSLVTRTPLSANTHTALIMIKANRTVLHSLAFMSSDNTYNFPLLGCFSHIYIEACPYSRYWQHVSFFACRAKRKTA